MNDQKLLSEYADFKSEQAFAALVERHLPLVYSAALRQTDDPALSENLTHVVFILLARKSDEMSRETILVDWLFATMRHAIAISLGPDYQRAASTRNSVSVQTARPSDIWEQFLDGALAQLSKQQRAAVLLHYFQFNRPGEIGLALGISEEAVQESLANAIARLHKLLLKRGVALPESVLPGLLMTRGAKTPPSYLGPSVTAAALNQRSLSTAVYALLQGVGREPLWPRLRPRLRTLAQVAILVLVTGLLLHFWPRRNLGSSQGYTFDTRIVLRPAYVAPPLPELSEPAKPVASMPLKPFPTNTPSSMPVPMGVTTNVVWAPGGTVVDLPPLAGVPSAIATSPPEKTPQPDSSSAMQLPLWNAAAAYSPAQNLIPFNVGVGAIIRTSLVPWATAQRSLTVVPPRPRPKPPGSPKTP